MSFIDHNAETIFNDFLEQVENKIGEPLYPGDERRIFAEAVVSVLISFLAAADDKAMQSRLQYARGEVLDSIGEMFDIDRISENEDDDDYRYRIQLKMSSYASGTENYYKNLAFSANPNIQDVSITNDVKTLDELDNIVYVNQPGTVAINIMMKNGSTPTDEELQAIQELCSDPSVRCFNDKVVVQSAEAKNYKISVVCYIDPTKNDVENTKLEITNAVEVYKTWQDSKLGRNINKDKLQMFCMQAGAYKVSVNYPSHKILSNNEYAKCESIGIIFNIQEET